MSEHKDQSVSDKLASPGGQGKSSSKGAQVRQKKAFVEPTVSLPIDVLEATTIFLQGVAGGSPLP